MSVYARGCAESQSSSLVLMFPVCRWMCVCAHLCVCVYLCLMGRLMEETRGSELCPIGYRNQLTQALPRLMPRSLLSSFPVCFFFLSACIAIFTSFTSFTSSSPSCLSSTCYRSSGDTFSLFPRLFSLSLCSFSPFISFHIYSSPTPPPLLPPPSLPVCG